MSVERLVDHLFRRSAGRMVAALTRSLGPERLADAEEAVQDALIRALEVWPFRGVPADPEAWLYRVARNRALDVLRRDANYNGKLAQLDTRRFTDAPLPTHDDELAMVFMCCHPALSPEVQITLTLKTVGGFSVHEIAAALLADPAAIAQRLVRAKRTLAERRIRLAMPAGDDLVQRTGIVLDVLYLMFNEGYAAHSGSVLVRMDVCREALRLARLLCADRVTASPSAEALLALMLLQGSRLGTRVDDVGDLLLLDDQDRSGWDADAIAEGMQWLDRASRGDHLSRYHVEAAVAAAHAAAPDYAATDWPRILTLYDQLLAVAPSPVVTLNRAVALSRVAGAERALRDIAPLAGDAALRRYFPFAAVMGALMLEAGRSAEAALWYGRALELAGNDPERRFVERRLAACVTGGG